ncbi:hypothetical protein IIA79_05200, partial [bacterium]|nr:hypothetical protein [bacterium]
VALAGLRQLGCSRYMVGFRHPKRLAGLSSQFKCIRRQLTYFPLQEMADFFAWAERTEVFANGSPMQPPGNNDSPNGNDFHNTGPKRWDLLVNATPVGHQSSSGESLVTCASFLRCCNRVLDLVPSKEATPLVLLAREAGVPAESGQRMSELQVELVRKLWLKEHKRIESGEVEASVDVAQSRQEGRKRQRVAVKRRR